MLTSPHRKIDHLRSDMRELSQGTIFLRAVNPEVKGLLREEFSTGEGPDGPWKDTVRGEQALESRKLPNAFNSKLEGKNLRYSARTARDLLTAHQKGHKFGARQVESRAQVLRFSSRGKLASAKRFEKMKRGRAVFVRAHTIGGRVLPQRQIVPEGNTLPPKWDERLGRGVSNAMTRWYERAR